MTRMVRIPWQPGPAQATRGPVLVSLTHYSPHRRSDWPGIARAGLGLRRSWPQMKGAVGMWMWAEPLLAGGGSVSIWESEEDLMRFVRWPPHVAIMGRYRERGLIEARSWVVQRFDPAEAWEKAKELAGGQLQFARRGEID